MNKIIIAIVAIVILGMGAYYLLLSPDWRTYENARYEFSVDYPGDWELGDSPTNNDGQVFYSPNEEISCRAYGFNNSLLDSNGDPQTLDEFFDWLLSEVVGDGEVLERNVTVLGGKDAIELVSIVDSEVTRAVYSLNPETGWALACDYSSKDAMVTESENFEVMKNSFQVR